MADLYVPCIPLGYTFGRIGNFINGELYGRATTAPIGMFFPLAPDKVLRHPSQLYEAFFEGIFLFAVMWSIRKVRAPRGAMLGFLPDRLRAGAVLHRVLPGTGCAHRLRRERVCRWGSCSARG